ncbi:MAG: NAD(P)-binding protein, partial [Crenarchaeota archaeon]|nr:NAD(P)-binding protein [Thermoproteota archaeon]
MKNKIIILGAGIAGISAAYHLKKAKYDPIIFEQSHSWGGLCDNFEIDGFRFDKFIHLSFTKNEYVRNLFDKSVESIKHSPNPFNYYNNIFLKHPVQNNLYNLELKEKVKIIRDFINRKIKKTEDILDY